MRKQYESSKIKNKKKLHFFFVVGGSLKRLRSLLRFGTRNEKKYCGNIQ